MEYSTYESIDINQMSYSMEHICEMPIPELNELIFKANMTQKEKLDIKNRRKYYKINKASLKQQLNRLTQEITELERVKKELEDERIQYRRDILFYKMELKKGNTVY
ncbi:hypothetical protein LOD99_8299 [Oopsacas minuta]|uniref:BZIP domain-containing protein n=1 Tax=Oopsacas minuta TaxID=111878 RepID=A0AAV7JGN1_9METZ|nr:hypothetical protein LOD99_8299 [Oopsacas minuta]